MRPFLLSVELGHPVRCALVRIETTCRAFRALWIDNVSAEEAVITHSEGMISVHGEVRRSDFHAYVRAALRATVLHPLQFGSRDLRRISVLDDPRQPFMPYLSSRSIFSITLIAQFTFEHSNIHDYFYGEHPHLPHLFSTGHWVTIEDHDCRSRIACLRLGIHDHSLWAQVPFLESHELDSDRLFHADMFSRVIAIYFGANIGDEGDWSSSTAFTNEIPLDYLRYHKCCDSGVEAALRKVDQDQAAWQVGALLRVDVAIWDDDEWLTDLSLRVDQDSIPGEVES